MLIILMKLVKKLLEKCRNSHKGKELSSYINNFKSIVIDDIIYKSISEAARDLNTYRSTIYSRLNSPNKKFANYKYL